MNLDYMNVAIDEAKIAFNENEVPVGAVIVRNNQIISKQHNMKIQTNNVVNHAEILAIMEASKIIGDWRLNDCEMYITLEPCPMCASAIQQSRIKKIFIGTSSNVLSNKDIMKKIFQNHDNNHKVEFYYLNNKECSDLLSLFFLNKR